jgi:hypothetical protein
MDWCRYNENPFFQHVETLASARVKSRKDNQGKDMKLYFDLERDIYSRISLIFTEKIS